MRICFGEFLLDDERRELSLGGTHVHLTPKAYQLLEILIHERPRVVSRETLVTRLWPDTHVGRGSLYNLIGEVREALCDEDRTIIRNNYGAGFSFAAPVVAVDKAGNESPATEAQLALSHRKGD